MSPLGGKESRRLRFFLSRFVKKITFGKWRSKDLRYPESKDVELKPGLRLRVKMPCDERIEAPVGVGGIPVRIRKAYV